MYWLSKLHIDISLSTLEAEYIALSQAMRDILSLRQLLQEIGNLLNMDFEPPVIIHSTLFEDNNCDLGLDKFPRKTPRTIHVDVNYHIYR